MTLEGTPDIVSPSGVAGLEFLDEADTANRYARELRRRHGVEAIVVLLHEGGAQTAARRHQRLQRHLRADRRHRRPAPPSDVDLFVTGHTHSAYNCVIDGRPVTSASSFGRLFTDIDLKLDRRSRRTSWRSRPTTRSYPERLQGGRHHAADPRYKRSPRRSRPGRRPDLGRHHADARTTSLEQHGAAT